MFFNPLGLIAPIQLEKENINKEQISIKFKVPYEYARFFNSAKPLREEDYQKIESYIRKQYQKTFKDRLSVLNISYETRAKLNKNERLYTLTKLESKGYASPEGLYEQGYETLNRVDEKNLNLAKLRAEKSLELTKKVLGDIGISEEKINKVLENIKAEELQFSSEEWLELTILSKDYPGNLVLEKIFNMIVDYNDNKIEDKETLEKLHKIIGSKRMVEIETEFEGEEKTIYTLPIPFIIFLIPALRRFKRKKDESLKDEKEIKEIPFQEIPLKEEKSTTPELIAEKKLGLEEENEKEPEKTFIKVESFNIKPEEDKDFPEKVKVALCDDLYQFFDKPETIERGLDYRKICDEMFDNFDKFESDTDRENYIARRLLVLWREHDIKARRQAGWQEEGIDWGLDYENQPNQILWALAHAKTILRLVKEKRELKLKNEDKDYLELMARDVENYIKESFKDEKQKANKEENKEKRLKTSLELALEGRIAWETEKVNFD